MAADSTAKFMATADSTANVFGKKETAQGRVVGGGRGEGGGGRFRSEKTVSLMLLENEGFGRRASGRGFELVAFVSGLLLAMIL